MVGGWVGDTLTIDIIEGGRVYPHCTHHKGREGDTLSIHIIKGGWVIPSIRGE